MMKKLSAALLCGVLLAGLLLSLFTGSGESLRAGDSPPDGFRSLFDGKTLAGWTATPRVQAPKSGADKKSDAKSSKPADDKESFYQRSLKNRGKWTVKDGVLIGEQDPPASGLGAIWFPRKHSATLSY